MKFSLLFLFVIIDSAAAFTPSSSGVAWSHLSTSLEATRKPFICGNWKLNPSTKGEAIELAGGIASSIGPSSPYADVALFVPYVFIDSAISAVNGRLEVGAEVGLQARNIFVADHEPCLK